MAASCNLNTHNFKQNFDVSPVTIISEFDNIKKSDRVAHIMKKLNISNSTTSFQKPPFLPRLPEKTFNDFRFNSPHLVNNKELFERLQNGHDISNRPLFKRDKTFMYKCNLLRANQYSIVLEQSVSETLKKIKTADTPWIRSINANNKTMPFKSILNKNKTENSQFLSKKEQASNKTRPTSHSIKSYSNLLNEKSQSESELKFKSRAVSANPVKRISSSNGRKFAEDLFNDHITKSLSNMRSLFSSKDSYQSEFPDIALHALDTVWELHSYALKYSLYLEELHDEQATLQTPEYKKSLKNSKIFGSEKVDRMFHIVLEIEDKLITKHCLALALGNLYSPNSIEVSAKYLAGTLAAANLLRFNDLIRFCIESIGYALNKNTIGDCYATAKKYNHLDAIEICEQWLELNLMSDMDSLNFLKRIPLKLLLKTIKSIKFFVKNEYSNLIIILYWIFFNLNPNEEGSPTESVITTYFSSFSKDASLIEKYAEYKELLYSIRLFGISKANLIVGIQQMNLYPHSYLVKIMLEIQQSLGHGGDMNIFRGFQNSSIRHGFTIEVGTESYYSEIFSLYGFHFELITERIDYKDNKFTYQFYIQRLTSKNPVLTYEQSQLEMFSLRNDRLCSYSISVHYWNDGKHMHHSTGQKNHVFGIAKSQLSPIFEIEIPFAEENNQILDENTTKKPKELSIMYSFNFPVD